MAGRFLKVTCSRKIMVHLTRKKRNGKVYLYLEQRAWIDGKSRRLWQKYLGSEEKLQELSISLAPKKLEYKSMAFGVSAALLQVAQKIRLVEAIDGIAGKKREQNLSLGEYMLITIINRCVSPVSKSRLGKWFSRDALSTIFTVNPEVLNAQTYWNHFQLLDEEKMAQIETELTKNVLQIYQIDLSCLLFDPTNFFTYITEHETSQLPKFGHSKDLKYNLRIINLSLLCTLRFGVPVFHQTYEGNVQDAKHFKGVISKIMDRFKRIGQDIEEMVLIFDKGNHSSQAFHTIETMHMPFIASLRNSTQKDLLHLPDDEFTTIQLPSNGKEVRYYRTVRTIYDESRTVYVVHDPRKKKKAVILFEAKLQKRLTAINTFLTKLNVKKWRSKEKVEVKLKSLVGRKPMAEILKYSVSGSFGNVAVSVQIDEAAKAAYLTTLGRSILFTSQADWSPETVIQAFRDKYVVEDAFKRLKNPTFLSIRPMYHWADACIRAHVFSCVLGLLLLSLVRMELRQKSLFLSYREILTTLSELSLTQILISSTGPPFYKLNKHSTLARQLYNILKLKQFLPY